MNNIYAIPALMVMAGGAYADDFRDLAVEASDLKAIFQAESIIAEPVMIRAEKKTPAAEIQVQVNPKKPESGFVSGTERKDYIRKASLWVPEESLNTEAIDFRRGPFIPMKYLPEELETCRYIPMAVAYADRPTNGRTFTNGNSPKFKCESQEGKKLKVKYGFENGDGEMFSEVAASWLLTAIGAYADRMYPVRLDCPDCPSNPFHSETDSGAWLKGTRVAVEDKIGERIENKTDSGVGFNEFHLIEDRVGAEALIGLAHFLAYGDSKAANQAIACLAKDTVADPATGKAECLKPMILMQDMGVSFGNGASLVSFKKAHMDYDGWAKKKMWEDPAECILHIKPSFTNVISSLQGVDSSNRNLQQIGEKARQMLVRRLSLLSRIQLIDLFTAARAPDRKPKHSAEEWADLFLRKVEELRSPMPMKNGKAFACPYPIVPANSTQQPGDYGDRN